MSLITTAELQYYMADVATGAPWIAFLQSVIDTTTASMSLYLGWDISGGATTYTFFFEGNGNRDFGLPLAYDSTILFTCTESPLFPGSVSTTLLIGTNIKQPSPTVMRRVDGGLWWHEYLYTGTVSPKFYSGPIALPQTNLLKSVCYELCSLYIDASKRGFGTLGHATDYNTVFDSAKLRIDLEANARALAKLDSMKILSVIV